MAIFIPVPQTARFELIVDWNQQRMENVYHVHRPSTSWDATSLTSMAAILKAWWDASLKGQVSNAANLVEIIATDFTTPNSARVEYTTGLPIAGTNAGAALPANVTAAISWRTAFRGRSFRGRTFHVGFTGTMIVGSAVAGASQTALQTAYNALMVAVNSADTQLVVVSRFAASLPRIAGISTPITAVTVDGNVDSQRRRLIGRGG